MTDSELPTPMIPRHRRMPVPPPPAGADIWHVRHVAAERYTSWIDRYAFITRWDTMRKIDQQRGPGSILPHEEAILASAALVGRLRTPRP